MTTLTKQRGIIKGKLTRLANLDDAYSADVTAIDIHLNTLKILEDEFETIQLQIEETATPPGEGERDPQEVEREQFELAAFNFRHKMQLKRATFVSTTSDRHQSDSQSERESNLSNSTPRLNSGPRVKLEKVRLPTFSGNWKEWPNFYQLFRTLVHEDDFYNPVQKFYELKLHLSGDAATRIQNLELNEDNYTKALNDLISRYENKRLIIMRHFKTIFDLPVCSSESQLRALIDGYQQSINALGSQGLPTDQWDAISLYLLSTKLGAGLRRQWEITLEDSTQWPELCDFLTFLEQRAAAAEVLAASGSTHEKSNSSLPNSKPPGNGSKPPKRDVKYSHVSTATQHTCPICKEAHHSYQCATYSNSSVTDREKLVTKHRLCRNCLNPHHTTAKCRSSKCKKCGESHHTSLHPDTAPSRSLNPEAASFTGLTAQPQAAAVFLPSAYVYAIHLQRKVPIRMVIDSASQSTLITDHLARQLRLKATEISVNMEGVGGCKTTSPRFAAELTLQSRHSEFRITILAKILPTITHYRPTLGSEVIKLLEKPAVPLADDYTQDLPINILLGAEYWSRIMQAGKLELGGSIPPLLNSSFGWLASGQLSLPEPTPAVNEYCCFTLEQQLQRFWEIEETVGAVPSPKLTNEELQCEELFTTTTTRDSSGRYIVHLPFRENLNQLGDSRQAAERQFYQIERRMQRDSSYRARYHAFMREYEELGHMTRVEPQEGNQYFIPHHAVMSKFRVVFNGSQPTSTGLSLNDVLMVGPTVQRDLVYILNGFRRHRIGITCDKQKMYRQVWVHPAHRRYQQILYRFSPLEDLIIFELNTVTQGLGCAPYQATRAARQLAIDEGVKYPRAAAILINEDYIDDLLTGAATLEEALLIVRELRELTALGGFTLHKWNSNDSNLLRHISSEVAPDMVCLDLGDQLTKVLGMKWRPNDDVFVFQANWPEVTAPLTKRLLLSHISRIFDPLGLISPVIIRAKCLLQRLWLQPITWDEPLNEEITHQYNQLRSDLSPLGNLTIPRHISLEPTLEFTFHGFCDASEAAYACCVYIQVALDNGTSISHLLTSKTRVAPLKTISVPRLELCGAVLLSRLLTQLRTTYPCPTEQCYAYTDSTIVLSWLSKPPHTWKTFVSNRVSEICTTLPQPQWRHVRSEYNSADIASRGTTVEVLLTCDLWWNPNLPPPTAKVLLTESQATVLKREERKPRSMTLTLTAEQSILSSITQRYSSHTKMVRVLAIVLRAIHRFKEIKVLGSCTSSATQQLSHQKKLAMIPESTVEQLNISREHLIRNCQEHAFPDTIQRLRTNRPLKKRDPLQAFSPFLDSNGILRIRGRLTARAATNHPILLPNKHHFTVTLIRDTHIEHLHATANQIAAILRQRYWIINIRDSIRRVTRKCVLCRRLNSTSGTQQPTGDLPPSRTTPARPFSIVGVDYGGPLSIRFSLARKASTSKAYIALFVCFVTKAIHLELVSDLTTDAFLAALERFICRRGRPSDIYSDNGTNFTGAATRLAELSSFLESAKNPIIRYLAPNNINWHFIPPRAPNFGGLWEAGIKSAKRHLVAATKANLLTFEEVSTILCQAEACLNSRPLTPLSSDLDAQLLTPGHFLTGDALRSSPMTAAAQERLSYSKRWRMVQETAQIFWSTWSSEYLHNLQARAKALAKVEFHPGELVILREENVPALQWPMGRIEITHPGQDGIVRVVTVKTQQGVYKRPTIKLVKLDVDP